MNIQHQLDRIVALTAQLNDSLTRQNERMKKLEEFLEDHHVGVFAAITAIGGHFCYGRSKDKFRFFFTENLLPETKEIPYSNLKRGEKIEFFKALPELIDEIIKQLESLLEFVSDES